MIIACDFDHVIHNPAARQPGYKMGTPVPGVKEALTELYDQGHLIIVHTARARDPQDIPHVVKWLDYFEIPHDHVTAIKPLADVYLDDKAVRFTSWDDPDMLRLLHHAEESNEP